MTIKIRNFGFNQEAGLSVDFSNDPTDDALLFLTALGAFVSAYGQGRVVSIKADQNDQVQEVKQLAPAPSVAPPVVEETVVPPRAAASPKAAKAGSVQPAVSDSAPVSSPAPAEPAPTREAVKRVATPKATTATSPAPSVATPPVAQSVEVPATPPAVPAVDVSSVERVALDATPPELKTAKSFRAALVWLKDQGNDSVEKMVQALHKYGEVPCIARYLVPNPDPELAIEARVSRFFEVCSSEKAA